MLALALITSYHVSAEDSFSVSLQTSKTFNYDSAYYYALADVVKPGDDFYLFFCIEDFKDYQTVSPAKNISGYTFKLYYDTSAVELVKDDGTGTGSLIPMVDTDDPVNVTGLFNGLSFQTKPTNTSDTSNGVIEYYTSILGGGVFPTKADEVPYYRLASMHFKVKSSATKEQAQFSLETDKYKNGTLLYGSEGQSFAYSATATKTINIHTYASTLLPPIGTYKYENNKWYLTLKNATDEIVPIWYTTNISDVPTEYTDRIPLDTVSAIYAYTKRIIGNNTENSIAVTFATPTVGANPPPGVYDTAPGNIILYSIPPDGYDVYYTTDNSPFIKFDPLLPIRFPTDGSVLTIQTKLGIIGGGPIDSTLKMLTYSIHPKKPVANPIGGSFTSSVAVRFIESEQTTKGCTIYYTLDGTTDPVPPQSDETPPTPPTMKFDGSPINITSTSTLRAIAVKDGKESPPAPFTYTIIPPSSGGGGGGGGGTTTVYKYISIEKLLTELKYKVIDGKAVYTIPNIEGDLSGDYAITTDATQDEIEIKFTLQNIIDGARGLKKFIITTKTDTFILPFYNIDYPLAVKACNGINPKDVPVTLTYSRKTGESSLIDNADLTKDSKFYSYTLTSYIDKVAFPMRYLVGYAQYILPVPKVPSEKTLLGAAINGNIIQTPLYMDKTIAGKESVTLRTLSDHPVCMVYGDKRTYSDIEGDWSQKNIERLATLRIVNGRPEGFTPETFITRAELSAMISRALGAVMKDTVATPFKDLDKIHWSYYEANNAQNWNLIQGYPDFTFKPEQQVTRLETIQMIANAIKYTNRDAFVNTTEAGKYLSGIIDAESIESWAIPSVVMTLKYEIIKGYEDGSIRPNNPITRAETVTLIKRLLENFKLIN